MLFEALGAGRLRAEQLRAEQAILSFQSDASFVERSRSPKIDVFYGRKPNCPSKAQVAIRVQTFSPYHRVSRFAIQTTSRENSD